MKKSIATLTILMFLSVFMMMCSNKSNKDAHSDNDSHEMSEMHDESAEHDKKDCNEVHWSHKDGEDGPNNWKNLCDGFLSCGGEAQSPVDIVTQNVVPGENLSAFEFNYAQSKVSIINNGHTVQFNIDGGSKMKIQDKEYELLQFHYHAKSEHTIDGEQYPIEVHFVHKHSDVDYAVVGIMFTEGEENELFASYLENFPVDKGEYNGEEMIELSKLMPKDMSYYHYNGSLTTPPCSEVVNWYVLKSPLNASKEQINQFSEILHNNFRPIMPLNERQILSYSN